MLSILVVIGIVFAMQAILGFFQMRNLTDEFIQLRRKGKVAFGRKSGGFRAGAVVMFRIDEDGIIQEARKLEGTTAFARVKALEGFEGRYLGTLTKEDAPKQRKMLPNITLTLAKRSRTQLSPTANTRQAKKLTTTRCPDLLRKRGTRLEACSDKRKIKQQFNLEPNNFC